MEVRHLLQKESNRANIFFEIDESYVIPLIVSGGGGGSGDCNADCGQKRATGGYCGDTEEGAGEALQQYSSGGAGFNTSSTYSHSFLKGGSSDPYYNANQEVYCYGGFGGGGSAFDCGGGGGGFKGGNSGKESYGGEGGSSFNIGEQQLCIADSNEGNGYVTIIFPPKCPSVNEKQIICNTKTAFLSLVIIYILKS